ncbi:GTP-binding protein [Ordospora colligata]|uniref:GTP-binding protein n=1 Tax=Ordospora colligata OC4 TaxID=1354746 RepID=A0A0B2UJD6_9MICR|nr:GTP-binding protein [Ordospora colligata OC4]KHN69095.1 GTP-binding protein [Ordospora colligata OC4]TBU14550.1 GTP-binding protein [Ordospora colligata]TBU18178.1 GTP-binding protein [Ordospora colligata]
MYEWGKLIVEKRFGDKPKIKPSVKRCSITEYGGINRLSEELSLKGSVTSGGKPANAIEEPEQKGQAEIMVDYLKGLLDFSLSIPPRVPYDSVDKSTYAEVEERIFEEWRRRQKSDIFERNIEIWRQFWITCERSDTIVQIVDARNPEFFINNDVRKMYPTKRHVLMINKDDLSSTKKQIEGYECLYYSALDIKAVPKIVLGIDGSTIGFIGYPNVGKSSTINLIMNQKRVKVSQTPGKTKAIQTIPLGYKKRLLDCPGLVFPRHSKIDLMLHGILNVDQLLDLNKHLEYIIDFVGINKLCRFYSLKGFYNDSRYSKGVNYINLMSSVKGWEVGKCLKMIIKDFTSGKIPYEREIENLELGFDWYVKE